jgi:hypothetical protein
MPPNATLAFEQKLDWTLVSTRSSETGQELGRYYGLRSYASGLWCMQGCNPAAALLLIPCSGYTSCRRRQRGSPRGSVPLLPRASGPAGKWLYGPHMGPRRLFTERLRGEEVYFS